MPTLGNLEKPPDPASGSKTFFFLLLKLSLRKKITELTYKHIPIVKYPNIIEVCRVKKRFTRLPSHSLSRTDPIDCLVCILPDFSPTRLYIYNVPPGSQVLFSALI